MSVLEKEILEKFNLLDSDAKERVRSAIVRGETDTEAAKKPFDYKAWLASVEELRAGIRADNGGEWPFPAGWSVQAIRELRDGDDDE